MSTSQLTINIDHSTLLCHPEHLLHCLSLQLWQKRESLLQSLERTRLCTVRGHPQPQHIVRVAGNGVLLASGKFAPFGELEL